MKGCFGFRPSPGVDFPTPLDATEADFAPILLFSSLVRTFVPGLERPTVQIGRRDDEFRVIEIRILATRVENQRTGRVPGGGPLGAPGGCSRAAFWLGCAPGVCLSPAEPAGTGDARSPRRGAACARGASPATD